MKNEKRISNVPTNIITGFLGSGKTTAILHLLECKPAGERWAVLVNEFGEIGVDGSLFEGQHGEEYGVFVGEVPGGCMCCTASLPMQIALNKLLLRARPHRLLIELTGLGHPIEVLNVLSGQYYQESLSIQNIVTLVDARKLSDKRYTTHDIFNQQISIADIIIGNKSDLYQDADRDALKRYVSAKGASHAKIVITEYGKLELSWLQDNTQADSTSPDHHYHDEGEQHSLINTSIPESGYIKAENQMDGFNSIGWRFASDQLFDHSKLFSFLSGLTVERMKGVCITESGIFGYNLTTDGITEMPIVHCVESKVEIIATNIDSMWEQQLLDCIIPNA